VIHVEPDSHDSLDGKGDYEMTQRKNRRSEEIICMLKKADLKLIAGESNAQVCLTLKISEATYRRWRSQYGGTETSEARRLYELELENTWLKKLLAEAEIDNAILTELAGLNSWSSELSNDRGTSQQD